MVLLSELVFVHHSRGDGLTASTPKDVRYLRKGIEDGRTKGQWVMDGRSGQFGVEETVHVLRCLLDEVSVARESGKCICKFCTKSTFNTSRL
jgi:hypothetical protein